jgi:hypothetical protein
LDMAVVGASYGCGCFRGCGCSDDAQAYVEASGGGLRSTRALSLADEVLKQGKAER